MTIPPDEAINTIINEALFYLPPSHDKGKVVEAIHAIIADVIDSAELAIITKLTTPWPGQMAPWKVENLAQDVTMTVNDYVANHYGIEEFGL